jgi:hypothetical protein
MPRRGAKVLSRVPAAAAIVALVCVVATGHDGVAQPLVLLSVMLAPTLLPRTLLYPPPPSPSPDDGGDDGGGGRGPGPDSPKPADGPSGGLPRPDARPAKGRRRDHGRPTLIPPRPRRGAPEPQRAPRRRSPA